MSCKPVQHFNGQNVCVPFLLAENYQNYDISSERQYADSLAFIKRVEHMSMNMGINLSGAVS